MKANNLLDEEPKGQRYPAWRACYIDMRILERVEVEHDVQTTGRRLP
jgi:hypothetical protein